MSIHNLVDQKKLKVLFLAFVAIAFIIIENHQIPQNSIVIEFKNGSYNPQNITIKQNQTVTFVNHSDQDIWPASNIHPTHQIYLEFDPQKPINAGKSWSFTFTKAGTWKYHDHLHPQLTGEIKVE